MSDAKFKRLAPRIVRSLLKDIPQWEPDDAFAVLGNAGHESAGFTKLQEIRPVVPGSRGGWGWFQWTGPRRRAFEAWARQKGYAFDSYEANYGFLIHELRGPENHAIRRTKMAEGLDAKVVAFELAFERAGVKHYPARQAWARKARDAYRASQRNRLVAAASAGGTGAVATVAEVAAPGTTTDVLGQTRDALVPLANSVPAIAYVVAGLALVGLGIALYRWWKSE
jgi:hypothetical protein